MCGRYAAGWLLTSVSGRALAVLYSVAGRSVAWGDGSNLFTIRRIVALIVGLVGVYVWVSYRMAADLTMAERTELEGTPADFGHVYEPVRFMSRRGDVMLDGWYMAGRGGMPVIVLVHGIGSNRTGGDMTDLACILSDRGYGVLMFDLRGHGESGDGVMSGGWHERMDVLGAIDYLLGRGVPSDSIGLLGFSLGAATCALAAAEEPRVRAAVLDCPFARASELIQSEAELRTPLPGWVALLFKPLALLLAGRLYDIDVRAVAPEDAVAKLDYPILVIVTPDDDRVPPEHGVRVHEAAKEGSELWMVEDVEHCGAFTEHRDEYVERVCDYFESRLTVQ